MFRPRAGPSNSVAVLGRTSKFPQNTARRKLQRRRELATHAAWSREREALRRWTAYCGTGARRRRTQTRRCTIRHVPPSASGAGTGILARLRAHASAPHPNAPERNLAGHDGKLDRWLRFYDRNKPRRLALSRVPLGVAFLPAKSGTHDTERRHRRAPLLSHRRLGSQRPSPQREVSLP